MLNVLFTPARPSTLLLAPTSRRQFYCSSSHTFTSKLELRLCILTRFKLTLHNLPPKSLSNVYRDAPFSICCHKEVEEKLKSMGMIDESIAHIIGHLIEQNYLNEERFTVQFTLGKLRIKSWGLERILRELKLRGISSYNLKKAATVFEEEPYLDIFDQLAQRKIEAVQGLSLETRKKKVFEYLRYRGWSTELIYEKLNAIN